MYVHSKVDTECGTGAELGQQRWAVTTRKIGIRYMNKQHRQRVKSLTDAPLKSSVNLCSKERVSSVSTTP